MPTLEEIRKLAKTGGLAIEVSRSLEANPRPSDGGDASSFVKAIRTMAKEGKLEAPKKLKKADPARAKADDDKFAELEASKSRHYAVTVDGDDALLKFGKHRDKSVSNVMESDRGYLEWMLTEDFPKDLLDVVRHQLKKGKRSGKTGKTRRLRSSAHT